MKKLLAIICAAMLCVCCLALAACGGSSGSGSGSASASSSSASPAEQAVGTWKLAAIETQGITMAGDFSMFLGSSDGFTLTIEEGGKATMAAGTNSVDLTWEANDTGITVKAASSDSSASSASASTGTSGSGLSSLLGNTAGSGETQSFDATVENGVLTISTEGNGQAINMYLTADGSYDKAVEIDPSKAQDITAEADVVGTWNLTGVNMMGITMYGDPADLASVMGGSTGGDMSLVLESGGKGTLAGSSITWSVDSKGAAITMSGQSLPLKKLGDNIIVDFSEAYGMDMVMAFAK